MIAFAPEQGADITADETPVSSTPAATSPSPLGLLVTQAVIDSALSLGVLASRVEALEAQLS